MKKSILTTLGAVFAVSLIFTMAFTLAASAEECVGAHSYDNGICTACGAYQPITPNGSIYEINNAGQLYWFSEYVSSGNDTISGKLMTDINLNPGYTFNTNGTFTGGSSPRVWSPIGNNTYSYKGEFIGNGKTVSGIYYNNGESDYIGLFGQIDSGSGIHDVGVINSYISGAGYVGGICGHNTSGIIKNSYNTGTVKGSSNVGGVCGYILNSNAKLDSCYNTGSVSGTGVKGGVCGYSYYGNIINCYYLNTSISGGNSYGSSRIASQFNDGSVAYELNGKRSVGTEENPLAWYQMLTGANADEYPVIDNTHGTVYCVYFDDNGFSTAEATEKSVYTNSSVVHYMPAALSGGIYQIENSGNLYWFAAKVNGGETSISGNLTTDINLNPGYTFTFVTDTGLVEVKNNGSIVCYLGTDIKGTVRFNETASEQGKFYSTGYTVTSAYEGLRMWSPIGNNVNKYTGTFDGNGKTVSGMYINGSSSAGSGLFGSVGNDTSSGGSLGTVSKVKVASSYVRVFQTGGGVCGGNYGIISDCSNSGVVCGQYSVGGVCGTNGGIITNCSNSGMVYGETQYIGGVCGANSTTISGCCNSGSVYSENGAGGVCGENYNSNATIKDSYNIGAVNSYAHESSTNIQVGGVCGRNREGTISNCFNAGAVSGIVEVGGVCGVNYSGGIVNNCYNTGTVNGNYNFGSVCGIGDGEVENCYYLAESETDSYDGTTFKTAAQFADGSVAYELNGKRSVGTEENPLAWYQMLTGENADEYPMLDSTRGTVYIAYNDGNGIYTANVTEDIKYFNSPDANYEPAELKNGCYEIANGGQLFWFAAKVNGRIEPIEGKLTENIFLNPGYTFTFDPDTGLVIVKKDGGVVGYFGTGAKGDSSGDNTDFDGETASTRGEFYLLTESGYAASPDSVPDDLHIWTPIKAYSGFLFDGTGKKVNGIYFNDTSVNNAALFGTITTHGTIKNVNVENSYINGNSNVSGVCAYNSGKVTGCSNSGIVISQYSVGGVCGTSKGDTVDSCYNSGTIIGYSSVGGVCGGSSDVLTGCRNNGRVIGVSSVGGVLGVSYGSCSVRLCHNTGAVSGSSDVGGICGFGQGININMCYNIGTVNGSSVVGGICGLYSFNGSINSCYNAGTVSGDGICGLNSHDAKIDNCYYLAASETANGGRTAVQFADGTVAWLLSTAGKNDGEAGYTHSGKWSQGASYPIFADATHKAIYKISVRGAKTADYYTDATGKCPSLETVHIEGISVDTVHSTDTAYTANAVITGVTPTVTDSIRFTYHVTVARDLIPTLDITFGGKTVTLTSTPSEDGDYLNCDFTFEGILPQQMTENIAAKLMISGTQYATKSQYSVKAYVFSQLPTGDYTLEKFLVNMLYYGEAAQRHLGRTENLATEGLDALLGEDVIADYRTSDSVWNTLMPETVKAVTDTHEGEIITWKSATLVFDKTITMRLRFTAPASTVIPLDYRFNNTIPFSDAVNEITEEGIATYYIDIAGFTPTDYENAVTVTLYNNETTPEAVSEEATYSVMSYIASMKDSERMSKLVRALYDYGISGKAYKETIGS